MHFFCASEAQGGRGTEKELATRSWSRPRHEGRHRRGGRRGTDKELATQSRPRRGGGKGGVGEDRDGASGAVTAKAREAA